MHGRADAGERGRGLERGDLVPVGRLDRVALVPQGCGRDERAAVELVRYGGEYGRQAVWTVYAPNQEGEERGGQCGGLFGRGYDGGVVLGLDGA